MYLKYQGLASVLTSTITSKASLVLGPNITHQATNCFHLVKPFKFNNLLSLYCQSQGYIREELKHSVGIIYSFPFNLDISVALSYFQTDKSDYL